MLEKLVETDRDVILLHCPEKDAEKILSNFKNKESFDKIVEYLKIGENYLPLLDKGLAKVLDKYAMRGELRKVCRLLYGVVTEEIDLTLHTQKVIARYANHAKARTALHILETGFSHDRTGSTCDFMNTKVMSDMLNDRVELAYWQVIHGDYESLKNIRKNLDNPLVMATLEELTQEVNSCQTFNLYTKALEKDMNIRLKIRQLPSGTSDQVYDRLFFIHESLQEYDILDKIIAKYRNSHESSQKQYGEEAVATIQAYAMGLFTKYSQLKGGENVINETIGIAFDRDKNYTLKAIRRIQKNNLLAQYQDLYPHWIANMITDVEAHSELNTLLKKRNHEKIEKIVETLHEIHERHSGEFFKRSCAVINKYINHEFVWDYVTNFSVQTLDRLMKNHVYKLVTKVPQTIDFIDIGEYSEVAFYLNPDIIENSDIKTISLISRTHQMIMSIHEERGSIQKDQISRGFFDEMNRTYLQGYDLKSRFRYLKQYCKEVQARMHENASELMVVTNA